MSDPESSDPAAENLHQLAVAAAQAMYGEDRASQALGMALHAVSPGHATMRMRVRADMLNGFAICHGGVIFALADSAFAFACNSHGRMTVASAATIEFLRPARLGDELTAVALEQVRSGRTGLYDVRVSNQNDETIALFRGRSHERGGELV